MAEVMEKEKRLAQGYKKLKIYRLAHDLAVRVHKMTLDLPKFEMFEEGSQNSMIYRFIESGEKAYKSEIFLENRKPTSNIQHPTSNIQHLISNEEKMKAIILAAGKGERLKKIVKEIPKPMVSVKNKPILEHNIGWLKSYGIEEIYINLHHLAHVIQNYFKDGANWRVNITYSYEPTLLGTAGAVRKIADEYWNNENIGNFLVVYGDNLFNCNLEEILSFHQMKRGVATIAVYEKEEVSQSGIVVLDKEDRIIKFIEKPKPEEVISHLVNTGIYVLEPKVLDYIKPRKFLDFGKDIFPEMIEQGEKLFGKVIEGNLIAIDTPELYLKVGGENDNYQNTF